MILLYLYRMFVFIVSALSHYAAFYALLWFGQIYGQREGFLTGDYIYNEAEIAVLAAMIQGFVFLMMISPLGGMFHSASMPVRRMSKREAEVLNPLLQDVMGWYKDKKMPRIKRVHLRVEDNTDSNAYAFGKNTIALTSGFYREYRWKPDVIKGVIAHELGHLHHKDLRYWQYVASAGGVLTFVHGVLAFVSAMIMGVASVFLPLLIVAVPVMMVQLAMSAFIYVVRLPETALIALSSFFSRTEEYRADSFAADIIGVKGMISFLESIKRGESFTEVGFLTMQRRSHPPSELRLEKLYDHPGYANLVKERRTNPTIERTIKRKVKKKKSSKKQIFKNYSDNNLNYLLKQ